MLLHQPSFSKNASKYIDKSRFFIFDSDFVKIFKRSCSNCPNDVCIFNFGMNKSLLTKYNVNKYIYWFSWDIFIK